MQVLEWAAKHVQGMASGPGRFESEPAWRMAVSKRRTAAAPDSTFLQDMQQALTNAHVRPCGCCSLYQCINAYGSHVHRLSCTCAAMQSTRIEREVVLRLVGLHPQICRPMQYPPASMEKAVQAIFLTGATARAAWQAKLAMLVYYLLDAGLLFSEQSFM